MRRLLIVWLMATLTSVRICFADGAVYDCNLTVVGRGTVIIRSTPSGECGETVLATLDAQEDIGQAFALKLVQGCTNQKVKIAIQPNGAYVYQKIVANGTVITDNPATLEFTQVGSVQIYASPVNFVETTIHNVDGTSPGSNLISRAYTDGLGKPVQNVTRIMKKRVGPSGPIVTIQSLVSGTIYDELGRPKKSVLPFVFGQDNTLDYLPQDIITSDFCAIDYYQTIAPDAGNYPYSETEYYDDPLGRVKSVGAPGTAFSMNTAQGHPAASWYFGSTGDGTATGNTQYDGYFNTDGCIKPGNLNSGDLNALAAIVLTDAQKANVKYFLTVTRTPGTNTAGTDADYQFSQTLVDIFGKTVKTAAKHSSAKNIISTNEYDVLGQLITETPPATATGIDPTTYTYNKLGQMISKTTPDAGTSNYTYDELGRLASTQDAKGNLVENTYDDLGRVIQISVNGTAYTKNYYDYSEGLDLIVVDPSITPALLASLQNTVGRLVLSVYYPDGTINGADPVKIVDLYSYDDEGRIQKRFKILPGLALQEFRYGYDIQGKILADTLYTAPATTPICNTYTYDLQGRLSAVYRDPDATNPLVAYTYDDLGKVTAKTFVNPSTSEQLSNSFAYNVRNWVTRINDDHNFFDEKLYYNEGTAPEPQFNGNISRTETTQAATGYELTLRNYAYDKLNRLLSVHTTGPSGSNGGTTDDELDAQYSYDEAGRITTKQEGLNEQKTGFCEWGEYAYMNGKSRLRSIAMSPKSGGGTGDNFLYDANGNMILDRSKHMIVDYDWRDLPTLFMFYASIPNDIADADGVRNFVESGSVAMVSAVKMTYDGSGNRVKKEAITPYAVTPGAPGNTPLEITKLGTTASVEVNKMGVITTALPVLQNTEDPSTSGSLEILTNDDASMSFSETSVYATGKLIKIAAPSSQTGDLEALVYSAPNPAMAWQAGPADVISGNGQFDVQGDFVSGVCYVEGSHVYERNSGDPSYTLAYVNFAEGKTLGDADNRVFYLKDHLGSTRITLASDFAKKEAIVYKPYGSEIILSEAPASDVLRQRFTGKELDKEGAQFGQLNIDIKLNFALDPAKSSRLGVYFTDAPSDPLKAEVLSAEIDPVTGYGRIRGTINYTANRTISWIHFVLNDNVSCGVQGINEQVGPGMQLTISQEMSSISEFSGDKTKSFLDYARDNSYNVNGIQLSYFGKRYYDAEIAKWTTVDPEEQYFDAYAYTRGNPICFLDFIGLSDVHFMLGSTYSKKYGQEIITMQAFKSDLSAVAKEYEDKGYTVQYDLLTSKNLNTALDDAQYIYTISHATPTGKLIGRDKTRIGPENVAKENATTQMKSFGCLLGNFIDKWREKIANFVSWNTEKTDTKVGMQNMKAEADLDATFAPNKKEQGTK
jgi:RHS repeat-associated protein